MNVMDLLYLAWDLHKYLYKGQTSAMSYVNDITEPNKVKIPKLALYSRYNLFHTISQKTLNTTHLFMQSPMMTRDTTTTTTAREIKIHFRISETVNVLKGIDS